LLFWFVRALCLMFGCRRLCITLSGPHPTNQPTTPTH
jgi:hypothetical protein